MKKPRKIDNFPYRHFKHTNHSPSNISIQPVEKIVYDGNSTKRYRTIHRHELGLKWIKLLQTSHPLGFNDNIYHEGNIFQDYLKYCREIAASLNDFSNRWCKRKNVEPDALKEWKMNVFKIIDTRISFYSRNTHLFNPLNLNLLFSS